MKPHGIERQTLLITTLPILLLGLFLESYFMYVRFDDLDHALLDRGKLIARQLAESSEYAIFSGNTSLLQQQANQAFTQQDVNAIVILDSNRKFLVGSGDTKSIYDESTYYFLEDKASAYVPIKQNRDSLWLFQSVLATQVPLNDLEQGAQLKKTVGSIVVEISKRRLNNQKLDMLAFNLLLTIAILLAAFLLAMHVSRRITIPIMNMSTAIRRIGEGRLDTRIDSHPQVVELLELAYGINQMAEQLQQERELLQHRIKEATSELLQKKEEAERLNFDKTRFLAAASHDLRQPMHALGLFVGELHSKLSDKEQINVVGKIEESVNAMSELLESLLDISKLDAGIVAPAHQKIAIQDILNRLVQDFLPQADKKNIRLLMRSRDFQVVTDPILLERILLNLISNAIRYTPYGGTVFIACRKRADCVRIEVRDNGIGIPSSEHKNVYREFIQLANQERDRSKGLGLGLAIVDRLSRLLSHPLYLRSQPDAGSVFAIQVPLAIDTHVANPTQPNESVPQPNNALLEGRKILIVDDDPLVRMGTKGIFDSWGCKVFIASSVKEAEHYLSTHFDLIICDYRLPDGDGLSLVKKLNASSAKENTPCILISGDTDPELLQRSKEYGSHLLHKPVRPAKLRSLVLFLLKN